MRRHVVARGPASATELEPDGAARFPPCGRADQRRIEVAHLRRRLRSRTRAGHADSRRAAPVAHPGRCGVVALKELQIEEDRTALSKEALKNAFLDDLFYVQGKFPALATQHDYYMALAYAVRDRMLQRWISTATVYTKQASRTVAYLSAEFLMGPHLGNNLINLGILDRAAQCVAELGLNVDEL